MTVWIRALCGALVAVFLGGCAYNFEHAVKDDGNPQFDLRIVQSDDYGSFWNTKVAQETLDHVEVLSKRTNTLVVLFIHGWHHNADESDSNLRDFKKALGGLHDRLSTQGRKSLRAKTTNSDDFKVVGIYVGWRGRSLPGLADYLTFEGRKNTAERVGAGDVFEFIERLQRIYLRANAYDPDAKGNKPFTGLVTIGHSFGGQVLWKSLARQLEDPLVRRAACMSNALDPAASKPREVQRVAIDSLGDLNVLVNPALEAYQYARVDSLYRQLEYRVPQTPQVVVFSADNDDARKFWFPLARGLSGPFRPNYRPDHDGYQGTLYGTALGEVTEQQTHTLTRTADPKTPDSLSEADYATPGVIRDYDFTGETVFGGVRLAPIEPAPGRAGRVPFSPVLVVQSKDKIIDGHNGIFEPEFLHFLTRYVAFIEGKRLLLRSERLKSAAASAEPAAIRCAP